MEVDEFPRPAASGDERRGAGAIALGRRRERRKDRPGGGGGRPPRLDVPRGTGTAGGRRRPGRTPPEKEGGRSRSSPVSSASSSSHAWGGCDDDDDDDECRRHRWTLPPRRRLAPRIDAWLALAASSTACVASLGRAYAGMGGGARPSPMESLALSTCCISFIASLAVSCMMRYGPARATLPRSLGRGRGGGVRYSGSPAVVVGLGVTFEMILLSSLLLMWTISIPTIVDGWDDGAATPLAVSGVEIWNTNLFYSSWISYLLCAYLFVEVWTLPKHDRSGTIGIIPASSFSDDDDDDDDNNYGRLPKNAFTKRWTLLLLAAMIIFSASISTYTGPACAGSLLKQTGYCSRALSGILMGGLFQVLICLCVGALYRLSRMRRGGTGRRRSRDRGGDGERILSVRLRDVGSTACAAVSLVVQAFDVALLTGPAGGGPGNASGTLYFGGWLGFALSFELCLRYLELCGGGAAAPFSSSASPADVEGGGGGDDGEDATAYDVSEDDDDDRYSFRNGGNDDDDVGRYEVDPKMFVDAFDDDIIKSHVFPTMVDTAPSPRSAPVLPRQSVRTTEERNRGKERDRSQERGKRKDAPPRADRQRTKERTRSEERTKRPGSSPRAVIEQQRWADRSDPPDAANRAPSPKNHTGKNSRGDSNPSPPAVPEFDLARAAAAYQLAAAAEARYAALNEFRLESGGRDPEVSLSDRKYPRRAPPARQHPNRNDLNVDIDDLSDSYFFDLSPDMNNQTKRAFVEKELSAVKMSSTSAMEDLDDPRRLPPLEKMPSNALDNDFPTPRCPSNLSPLVEGDTPETGECCPPETGSGPAVTSTDKAGGYPTKAQVTRVQQQQQQQQAAPSMSSNNDSVRSKHSQQNTGLGTTTSFISRQSQSQFMDRNERDGGSSRPIQDGMGAQLLRKNSIGSRRSASTRSNRQQGSAILTDEGSGSNPPPTLDGDGEEDSPHPVYSPGNYHSRGKDTGRDGRVGPPPPPFRRPPTPDATSYYGAPMQSILTSQSDTNSELSDPTLDAGLAEPSPMTSASASYEKKNSDETDVQQKSSDDDHSIRIEAGRSKKVVDSIVAAALAYAEKSQSAATGSHERTRGGSITTASSQRLTHYAGMAHSVAGNQRHTRGTIPTASSQRSVLRSQSMSPKDASAGVSNRQSQQQQQQQHQKQKRDYVPTKSLGGDSGSSLHSFYSREDSHRGGRGDNNRHPLHSRVSSSMPVDDIVAKVLSHTQDELHISNRPTSLQQQRRQSSSFSKSMSIGSMYSEHSVQDTGTNEEYTVGGQYDC